jgi:Domain of unknown function (DUF1902)
LNKFKRLRVNPYQLSGNPERRSEKIMRLVVVTAAYDDEARVWYVEESNIPGLRTEAPSIEDLRVKLPGLVEDLIEANGLDFHGDVPIEVIAHTRTMATVAA